jgi:hypothetical protein
MARIGAWLVVLALGGCGSQPIVVRESREPDVEWPSVGSITPSPLADDGAGHLPQLGRPRPLIRPGDVLLAK